MSILLPSPSFPSRELIGGVIVTYHPDVAFENRFDLVKYQVAHMVVVDNSCTPGVGARLSRLAGACVDVIKNDHNLGVATGLNQGVRRVDELGLSWALLLDQDTVVDDDLVDCLAEIWRQHASPTEIGLIGANSRSTASGRLGIQSSPGASGYVELKTIVTSGSLLAMAAYERIGPFRDDFFIDGVDLEYCLRLRGFGFRVLCSRRALMTHASGKGRERRFLSRVVLVGDHEPWRYYYMLRNFVHVARAYVRREPSWVCAAIINLVKTLGKVVLYEAEKGAKLGAMTRGVIDGFRFREGPGAPHHPRVGWVSSQEA